jgi:hypothetical protein
VAQFHFEPASYLAEIRAEVPDYDRVQDEVAAAARGAAARRVLDLGAGTGETDATTPLTPGYDLPDRLDDVVAWLREAGFDAAVAWSHHDLAVVRATRR